MVSGKEIQVEDGGYARVHTAILEILAKARLSGAEFRCIHFLLRKTYGWNKKEDRISLSQWAEGTDTQRNHVLTTLATLVKKKIIYRRLDSGQIPYYGFNKYFEQWEGIGVDSERGKRFLKEELLPEQVPVPEQVTVTRAGNSTVTNIGNKTVTKAGTHNIHKDIIKDIKPPTEFQLMFEVLSRVCKVDQKLKRGQINRTAKTLRDADYTPQDVEYFEKWWKINDFRGQRNSPPTLAQVLDTIQQSKPLVVKHTKSEMVEIELPGGAITEAKR